MGKMTYAQQLLHPNWQKRRLEMLQRANWSCQDCGDKETTLHVHHKQYFKGRMAWEYSDDELAVLCEACHADRHRIEERIKEILTQIEPNEAFAVLSGYFEHDDSIDPGVIEEGRQSYPLVFIYGFSAGLMRGLSVDDAYKVTELAVGLSHENSESRPIFENSQHYFGRD